MSIRRRKKTKRKTLTPLETEQANHAKMIRAVFRNTNFSRVAGITKEIEFNGRKGDLDDIYIYENLVVICEYTCTGSDNISTHLLKKKILFDHIVKNKIDFLEYMEGKFPRFKKDRGTFYTKAQTRIIIVYSSRYSVKYEYKKQVSYIKYMDYSILQYFKRVTTAVHHSARHELLAFLGIKPNDVGHKRPPTPEVVEGLLLPESYSSFDPGYKIVTFYISAEILLQKSYVLRRDGWRDEHGIYQRMIDNRKIRSIRRYLASQERVFVNNIIVTLPKKTKLLDEEGDTVRPSAITDPQSVDIQIPHGYNTVGLIDGQHRVFSYHEGGENEETISKLRVKQNLLVTGIIFPPAVSPRERAKFEANLFLEINSTQTSAGSSLKQEIGLLLNPYSSESIAKRVIHRLDKTGPLDGMVEVYFFDKDKLKPTSVVSYALKPLVKKSGTDSLFSLWDNTEKEKLNEVDCEQDDLLEEYVCFCVEQINTLLKAVKELVAEDKWTSVRSVKEKVVSTSAINGLLMCLRRLIDEDKKVSHNYYMKRLAGLDEFKFGSYKSSQYAAMGRDLYSKYFE